MIKLSKRQMQVYELVMLGYSVDEIANAYELKRHRVRKIIDIIYKKAGVNSRYELMAEYILDLKDRLRQYEAVE